jgi:hypothetical protein
MPPGFLKFDAWMKQFVSASLRCQWMRPFLLAGCLFIGMTYSPAQSGLINFTEAVAVLKVMGDSILKGSADSVRLDYARRFENQLTTLLNEKGSMDYDFSSLHNVSVLTAPDRCLRIYTFICPAVDGSFYRYYGFVQWRKSRKDNAHTVRLTQSPAGTPLSERMIYPAGMWPGALYYRMIHTRFKGKHYYTLLGWQGNNRFTTRKMIDVLTLDNDRILFGAPLFESETGIGQRIVFEYNAQAVMSLTYDTKRKRIVFDHLSPPSPELTGHFSTYGPDFTYDAYRWKAGRWQLIKNVEVRNLPEADPPDPGRKPPRKQFYRPE